jgi:4-amino-4-deoxy-L-arabinose transferase-like glycosyltransferase
VRRLPDVSVFIPALVALLVGVLLYQLPMRTSVAIGSLGDQLFVRSSESLDTRSEQGGRWYSDELGADGRSRWTRGRAAFVIPGVGAGTTNGVLRVQGWPDDTLLPSPQQPEVTLLVRDGDAENVVARFEPTGEWADYPFTITPGARTGADLRLELVTSATFTSTQRYADIRAKGVRVDRLDLSTTPRFDLLAAGWTTLFQYAALVLLATLAVRWRSGRTGAALATGGLITAAIAAGLWLWRPWIAAAMPVLLGLAAVGAALLCWRGLLWFGRGLWDRATAGEALMTGGLTALAFVSVFAGWTALGRVDLPTVPPLELLRYDRTLILPLIPPIALTILVLLAGPIWLPDALQVVRRWVVDGWIAPLLLGIAGGAIVAWQVALLYDKLPFVGHADYADNAVVARSLLRGEGWRVPYVTQFYWLEPTGSVYRPQETWPLLQPVWMVPWMALFGPTAFGARVSNIVFNVALLLLVYHIGATLWDRRVGLLAALLTLSNHFFFRLTIFSTTDLGFVVLSMGAIWLFYRAWSATALDRYVPRVAVTYERGRRHRVQRPPKPLWMWTGAGALTGLMVLQKPSGAIFAVAMAVWAAATWWFGRHKQGARLPWRGMVLWGGLAALVMSPYIIRNFLIWGRPLFSTETYDAWILGYKGTRSEAWEEIYRVYFGDLPNRSWILRWGWDRTGGKLWTQVVEVGAYLLPPKAKLLGTPAKVGYDNLPWLGGFLSASAPTWLALLGVLMLRGGQRRLMGLVATVGVLYTLFLITYWHANEERYFVPFVPWLLLLAMGGLCALFDRVLAFRGGRFAGIAGIAALVLLWSSFEPHIRTIDAELDPTTPDYWGRDWLPDLAAYQWLEENTAPDDVIMTRVPWQLSFEADRPSLMIPNAPLTSDDPDVPTIMRVARYYDADYLVVNAMNGPGEIAASTLRPLSRGEEIAGFTKVYSGTEQMGRRPIYIYRFPADYAGAAPLEASAAPAPR